MIMKVIDSYSGKDFDVTFPDLIRRAVSYNTSLCSGHLEVLAAAQETLIDIICHFTKYLSEEDMVEFMKDITTGYYLDE